MLSISDVSDADYYLRTGGSGCGGGGMGGGEAEDMLAYLAAGAPPGEWYFPLRNDLGVSGEIHAEGPSGEAFRTALNELRHPVTGEQLGRALQHFRTVDEKVAAWERKHPEATPEEIEAYRVVAASHKGHAVHGWDMTFSVVKSISVMHAALEHEAGRLRAEGELEDAAARDAEAGEVIAAFRAGIDAAMAMAAEEFGVTRRGAAGPDIDGRTTMRHVPEANLQCAIFTHHVSRDRDPQLHAHVMVLNRILCEDNQWRALFASGLLKSKHQLDAVFTRVMEAELTRRLGWRFAMRPDGKAREVVGVSEGVRDLFSARSRALSEEADEKLRNYMAERKLKPEQVSALVRWRFQQRATIKTRNKKLTGDEIPSRAEEVARWDREIAREFHEGFVGVLDEVDAVSRTIQEILGFDPDAVIAQALADITDRKGTFNKSHLWWAIDRHLPDMLGLSGEEIVALLRELTDAAIEGREVVSLAAPAAIPIPASLINPQTGESVFEPPRGGRYTTKTHLEREDWLVKLLAQRCAPALTESSAHSALGARGLSAQQHRVASDILTSDRFIEVVNAAAGTGKSRLMAALSDASADLWGYGLTGFTCSQNAAEVLAREGVHRAHNIEAFLTHRDRVRRGEADEVEQAKFAVPRGGTMVVDEASMVSTPHAVRLLREFTELGVGRVVFIGDTAQVDAVDAGGGFALMTQHRAPHALTQVRRFAHEWERDASTRLRDGDLTALTGYDKHRRIRGRGEPEDVERDAVATVLEDIRLGSETVLVVGAGEKAAQLSSRIRAGLVAAGRVAPEGVGLHDKTVAGVGDLIQTRHNNRKLDVVNREVWRVEAVDLEAGTITARRAERDDNDARVWGARRELPAEYVREYVELAYAATVQAVQGRTVDVGHLLVDETMGRSRAYPGITRGRERNIMWVPVERPARRHRESDEDYEARIPSVLSAAVAAFDREDHTEAAWSIIAAEQARAENLGHLGPQWQQLIAEHREVDHRQLLREVVGTDRHALFSDLSLDGVLHLMRSAESHGYDVRDALDTAYRQAGVRLEGARSPASLLYRLLDNHLKRDDVQPTRTVEEARSYEERVPAGDDPEIEFARGTGQLMDARERALGELTEVEPPAWAQALLGGVPADIVEREERREKLGIVAGYRELVGWRSEVDPIGPAPSRAEPERRWAWLRASRALGTPERDVTTASDGELANKVLKWRREQEAMPRNVDQDLRQASDAAAYAREQIVAARERGEDPSPWVRMLRDQEARGKRLDLVDKGRQAAVAHTAKPRAEAQEALVEMRRRVERDRVVAERAAAKRAADERDRQQALDEQGRVHAAVGERWREQWVPDAPLLGSERWAEAADADAPAARAGLFNAALQWWRMGNPRDEREINERLETHEVDAARGLAAIVRSEPPRAVAERTRDDEPDVRGDAVAVWERDRDEGGLTHRALEKVRAGMDEAEARASEPSRDPDVLAVVHRYTARDMEGDAPVFGTREYADADPDRQTKAETRAGLAWLRDGDDLDERAHRADVAEERAAAREIAAATRDERQNHRTHREVAEARGEEPPPDRAPINDEPPVRDEPEPPARPDTSWVRQAERAQQREEPTEREPVSVNENRSNRDVREALAQDPRPEREERPEREVVRQEPIEKDRTTPEPQRAPEPEREPKPEREKPTPVERKPEPEREREPEVARTPTREPAKRDDLDEQLARSQAALDRIAAEKAARERETQQRESREREQQQQRETERVGREQERRDEGRREQAPVRDRDVAER